MSIAINVVDKMASKQRAVCFTDAEVLVLLQAIRDDREVLLCRLNTNSMIRKKNYAWVRIAADVSALGVALRTVTGVRNKWRDTKEVVLGQKAAAAKTGGGPAQKPHPFTDLVNAILGEGSALSPGIEVHRTDSSSTETCELQATVVSSNPVIPKEEYVVTGPDLCEVFLARSSPSRPASANATRSQEDMTPTTRRVKRRSKASEQKMKYDAGLQQLSDSQVETDKYRREFYKSATALNNLRIERETALTNLRIEREQLEILKLKRELGLE